VAQHDNLTKLATEFQKTKKFDPKINEYTGIDAEKAFIEAQAKVKKTVPEVSGDTYLEALDKRIMKEMEITKSEMNNMSSTALDDLRRNADPKGMQKHFDEITEGRGVGDFADDPNFLKDVAPVKTKKTRTMDDLVEQAYEEIRGGSGFAGDLKYDADILASEIATVGGKIYDDLAAVEKAGIYDLAYKRMVKNLKLKMDFKKDLKDIEQKIELQMFDTKGKKGNAAGGLIDGYATGGVSNLFRSR
jgi:hypothetical protein